MKYALRKIKEIDEKLLSKYDVMISCSLFKMTDSYRDFSRYVKYFLSWVYKVPKTACVRLYVDESVLEDPSFNLLYDRNIPHLEIIFYQFDDFIVLEPNGSRVKNSKPNGSKDNVYHDGTFGSIVRFLPFYNKPEIPQNIKYIWVSDVDLPPYNFDYANILRMKKRNADVSVHSKACNNKEWFPDSSQNPINAGKIILNRKVKPDFRDFEKYLKDVLEGRYEELKQRIIKNREGKQHYSPAKYFTYGFDELFLNLYFSETIKKYNHLIYNEIILDTFDVSIIDCIFEKCKKLNKEIFTGYKGNTIENKIKLRDINDIIYEKVKENYSYNSKRLNICLANYEKYRSKIIFDKDIWGLTSLVYEKGKNNNSLV
jgi:hypothetical protein